MLKFDRNKVTFQPCPREFPEWWREEHLVPYRATEEDIEPVRRLYQSPDMPKSMAIAYANIWMLPHGFLVHDTVLMGPWGGYESMVGLTAIIERFDLPRECLERAREFGLNEKPFQPCNSVAAMGHRIKEKQCTIVAREIWTPPAYHREIIAAPWPEFEPWFRNHILKQDAHTK